MQRFHLLESKHCRWCGKSYTASKPIGRDGFHSSACKQAHYRAYKKWVTATSDQAGRIRHRAGPKR